MLAEARTRLDTVLVDDAQRSITHVLGVVIVGKRKRVPGIEPAVVLVAALARKSQLGHAFTSRFLKSSSTNVGTVLLRAQSRCNSHSSCGMVVSRAPACSTR